MQLIDILSIFTAILFLGVIASLIRKGRLREEYSFVWLAISAVLLFFAVFRDALDTLAAWLNVYYAPALLFLAAFFAIVVFLVHLSVVNTKQHNQIRDLTQEMALLKNELEKVRREKK
jgi:hypothetical protein